MFHTALQAELKRLEMHEHTMVKTRLRFDDLEDAIQRVHRSFADELRNLEEGTCNGQPTCSPPVLHCLQQAFHRTLYDLLLSRAEALDTGRPRRGAARTKR